MYHETARWVIWWRLRLTGNLYWDSVCLSTVWVHSFPGLCCMKFPSGCTTLITWRETNVRSSIQIPSTSKICHYASWQLIDDLADVLEAPGQTLNGTDWSEFNTNQKWVSFHSPSPGGWWPGCPAGPQSAPSQPSPSPAAGSAPCSRCSSWCVGSPRGLWSSPSRSPTASPPRSPAHPCQKYSHYSDVIWGAVSGRRYNPTGIFSFL